jgi:putative transposase
VELGHRKLVRHYDEPLHVHELTFSCYKRRPLLNEDWIRVEVCQAIDRAVQGQGWRLFAFVLMPEHVHLIVQPCTANASTADLLRAIKRPSSYRIKQGLLERNPRIVEDLTVRQRAGVETFRFWQEGPGFDRNLIDPRAIEAAIDYVHANPVKRGLCEQAVDWEWSSARQFLMPEASRRSELPSLSPLPYDLL